MRKVAVIGIGPVGLIHAILFALNGHHVFGVDLDAERIKLLQAGILPIFEEGLEKLFQDALKTGRLHFATSYEEAIAGADIAFVCVGTPSQPDGSADTRYLMQASRSIALAMTATLVVVVVSTVPVGTCHAVEHVLRSHTEHEFHVARHPEYLRQGRAVQDALHPDRIVIGANSPLAAQLCEELLTTFVADSSRTLHMSVESAETAKLASNGHHFTNICYMNQLAQFCSEHGANIDDVRRSMTLDNRLGPHLPIVGPGAGGSCFLKDGRSWAKQARDSGCPLDIVEGALAADSRHRTLLAAMVAEQFAGNLTGKIVAQWGLAFKQGTDDTRESPALDVARQLLAAGALLMVHDPQAMPRARPQLGDEVTYCDDPYAAVHQADALVIVTEWDEYRQADLGRVHQLMRQPIIIDGRNLFSPETMRQQGFHYRSLGRPAVRAATARPQTEPISANR